MADPTSFTGSGPFSYNPGDLAFEKLDQGQDSLTQMLRSLTNLTGLAGKDFLASGAKTIQQGKDALNPTADFWGKLLSGDPAAQANAVAPTARTIVSQYDTAKKAALTMAPRGGARSRALAELPFKKAADIGTLIQQLQPEAAKQMTEISRLFAMLGISESGMGLQSLAQTLGGLLTRRGQNAGEKAATMQMIGQLGSGIGAMVGMMTSGMGGGKSGGGSGGGGTWV